MKLNILYYFYLVLAYFIYACSTIFSKIASSCDFFSSSYVFYLMGAVIVLGVYALLWQQIIKKIPISDAYMFKGTSLIFILILSSVLFGESITINNILGSVIIVSGIILYARA